MGVAATIAYKRWFVHKTAIDTQIKPFTITIHNHTDYPITVTSNNTPDNIVTLDIQGRWTSGLIQDIPHITVCFKTESPASITIPLDAYTHNTSLHNLHITMYKASYWKQWWNNNPYSYTIAWK